jgi:hypothetical protein
MVILFPRWRSCSRDFPGQQVLTGLTFAETREFELLDAEPPVDEHSLALGNRRKVISAQPGAVARAIQNASSCLQTAR